ncbi:MAG: AsmA family protein [Alphaproteobacteria bacterium]|nr:AsmA family protein [Alphaproteobacteria bacterium]
MLNRLYIVVGSLLILLIVFAFAAPYLIDWSDRRTQIEALAAEALGTPVRIAGGIDIHFLPQPSVTIDGISVGPEEDPVATIEHAEAILSLTDFLRDRFNVTSLRISGADIHLGIDENGAVSAPVILPETVNASNVSIANATLTGSAVTLTDARNGGSWRFDDIEGNLALSALRGPFGFNATGTVAGAPYQLRITTSQMNTAGELQVALYARAIDAGFALNAEGLFETGAAPRFAGKLSFRQPPPSEAGSVRGNLVLEAEFDADTERARLTNYVLVPDENRAGTRMTGAAELELGPSPRFHAVVSGGVVALAPRDARTASPEDPYELVRLIAELPPPPLPPLPGTINVDISELDLRAFALRDVRLDASADGDAWRIDAFEGKLPGDTAFGLTGSAGSRDGRPWAEGRLSVTTDRLDALVQLWRPPDDNVPLFGIEASLDTRFSLADGAVTFSEGKGQFDGAGFTLAGTLPSPGGRIDLTATLGNFNQRQSRELFVSLPEIAGDPAFAASFSGGSFDLGAEALELFGLLGSQVSAQGEWSGGDIGFSKIAAGQWGGASFNLSGAYTSGDNPVVTASGHVILDPAARDGALPVVYERFGIAPEVRLLVSRNLPASLDLVLSPPGEDGVQVLELDGRVASADLTFAANLTEGLVAYQHAPLGVRATLDSASPSDLAAALGLDLPLEDSGGATATLIAQGSPANSMDVQLTYVSPADKLQFTGNVIPAQLSSLKGRGRFEFDLATPSAWAEPLGLTGLYLPSVKGVAEIAFTGAESVVLTALNADAGGTSVRGDLVRALEAGTPLYTGNLALGGVDIAGFAALFGGGAALLNLEGTTWPDGPFAEADGPRATRGRISVTASAVVSEGHALAGATSFDLVWDDHDTRLRGLRATIGGGTMTLDFKACCTGTPGPRQVDLRLELIGIGLDALVPDDPARSLDARVSGSISASGTGDTIAAIIASLTGQGSFSARDLAIAGFDASAFETIAGSDTLIELDAEALAALVAEALASGAFEADELDGVLSLAGGTLRANNLAATGDKGKLYGNIALNLADLGLNGTWTLAPNGTVGDGGLINESTGRIGAVLGGTIIDPDYQLDLVQMVDSIQVRAFEVEVERLERLKAEDEARARAAAEERARLMALEAKRKAEEAAAKAEAEAKARAAAEEAARRAAAEEAARKAAEEAAARAVVEEAARKAAVEEAAHKAAEEAAARAAAEEDARKAAAAAAARETAAEAAALKAAEEEAARRAAAEAAARQQQAEPVQQTDRTSIEQRNEQAIQQLLRDLGESQDPQLAPSGCPALGSVAPADVPPGCPVSEDRAVDLLQ